MNVPGQPQVERLERPLMDKKSVMAKARGPRQKCVFAAGVAALLWAGTATGYDYQVYGDGVQLACWQTERSRLVCDFRRFAPPEPEQVTARLGARDLPGPRVTPYSAGPGTSAVMFLVDISDAELSVAPVAARMQPPPVNTTDSPASPTRSSFMHRWRPAPTGSATCSASSPRAANSPSFIEALWKRCESWVVTRRNDARCF